MCADSNRVLLYDAGTEYRRRPVSPAGDRSVFIALHPQLLDRLSGGRQPEGPGRFPVAHLPVAAGSWLVKEIALSAARARRDVMRLEELALAALASVVAALAQRRASGPRTSVGGCASASRTLGCCWVTR